MSWIEIHDTLPDHPKVLAAAHLLGIDRDMLTGKLLRLWTWAIDYRENGFFADCETELIAEKMRWTKPVKKLIEALTFVPVGYSSGLLEQVDGGYILHDWGDYAGKLITRRAKDRERKSKEVPSKKQKEVEKNSVGIPAETPLDNREDSGCYPNRNHNQDQETEGIHARARAREAIEFWEQASGGIAPRQLQDEIVMRIDGNDMELVREALRLSVGKRQPGAYFAKCLQNWRAEGIADYQAYCAKCKTGPPASAPQKHEKSFAEIAAGMEGLA